LPTRIEWLLNAREDLRRLGKAEQQRIADAVGRLRLLDDPRQRLSAYAEDLAGFWKLRVGDYRVVCELKLDGDHIVVVVQVVHRSRAYLPRNVRELRKRRSPH
jgi:mRNA interferase RelE/StbE